MKNFILFILFTFTLCELTFAQSPPPELEKVKEIKLLESTRDDVRRILDGYDFDFSVESNYYEWFSTKDASIKIDYSGGKCSADSGEWNVSEWIVTEIEVALKNPIELKNFGIDYSNFRKERAFVNLPRSYIYHKKDIGVAFQIDKNKIERIYLFPSKKDYSFLCNNETAKKYYLSKKWFVDSKLNQRYIDFNGFADVIDLTLNKNEIIADCASSDLTLNKSCSDDIKQISVFTKAVDLDNDVLTYNYYISGGKIIGTGANVVWDLSGVKAGSYSITAGADDLLCGVCGKTMTQIVVVKECPNCSAK